MPNKFYSFPKSVFEHYHEKIKDWVKSILPTKTSDLDNDSDFIDQLALAGIIAVTFSASSTYKVGDYVLYNHTLYRCKTAITTAGAWDASKWDAAKTQDIFTGSAPGLVPAAESGDADKVLKGDGTWGVVSASKIQSNSGSVSVGEDGNINIGSSSKVTISSPSVNISTGTLEGNLPTLVYKDIVKNVNSNIPLVLFGTNKSDKIQTNSSIPDYSGMTTFFAGYDPSMGPIIDYVNNNVSKLKVMMKSDVTYDSILAMYNASPYLPILNDGSQYLYPHFAAPGFGFSWFNFMFMGKDQKNSAIYYYFLSPDNVWSSSSSIVPTDGYDNTDIKTIVSGQVVVAELKTETIEIEV